MSYEIEKVSKDSLKVNNELMDEYYELEDEYEKENLSFNQDTLVVCEEFEMM